MIDNDLIALGSTHTQQCIINACSTESDRLWLLENFLPDDAITKLSNYIEQTTKWEKGDTGINYAPRKKIAWDSDTVIEEIHEIGNNLTLVINEKFPGVEKYFTGMTLWWDEPGYNIVWHTDHPIIEVALQIYLFNQAPEDLGTTFDVNGKHVLVPYKHNTGYLALHGPGRLRHQINRPVRENENRYSIYMLWSREPKKID